MGFNTLIFRVHFAGIVSSKCPLYGVLINSAHLFPFKMCLPEDRQYAHISIVPNISLKGGVSPQVTQVVVLSPIER